MNKILIFVPILFTFFGCNSKVTEENLVIVVPKPNVEIAQIRLGTVSDNLELFATTVYLKRNVVTVPVPAFITSVHIRLGQTVKKGQILYELETKEHRALGDFVIGKDSALAGFGVLQVLAPVSGVVTTFDKQQQGDYVLEGAQLCTIAESNDLAFQVNVPYEFTSFVNVGKRITLLLSDSLHYDATITTPLTAMNLTAQTQIFLARSNVALVLPESLIVKVLASKESVGNHQILPRSSVQSDEMMQEFWVLKMTDDSTAVKIPVVIGNKSKTEIEILSPEFLSTDRIVTVGGYGLPDTTVVNIINHE